MKRKDMNQYPILILLWDENAQKKTSRGVSPLVEEIFPHVSAPQDNVMFITTEIKISISIRREN